MSGWLPGQGPNQRQQRVEDELRRRTGPGGTTNVTVNPQTTVTQETECYKLESIYGADIDTLAAFEASTDSRVTGRVLAQNGGFTYTHYYTSTVAHLFTMMVTVDAATTVTVPVLQCELDAKLYVDGSLEATLAHSFATGTDYSVDLTAGEHTVQFLVNNVSSSRHALCVGEWFGSHVQAISSSTAFPTGRDGVDGTNGATWISGAGAPNNAVGDDGDFYINETNGDAYKKGSGAWALLINLKATDTKDVKVSSNDTTPGYLHGKLVAGTGVTLTENNNGGNETLTIAATGGGGGGCGAWGDITGTLSDQTDLNTALSGKVATSRTVNGHALTADVTVSKSDVGLGNADNTSDADKPISTATQTALDGKVDENAAITGATKTKITYDAKGLVTSGADATTADIADSADKRYVTDAQQTVLGNTSGTNTGDQDLSGYVPTTRTVNGHALSANVTVTKSDVGLGNVLDSAQIPAPASPEQGDVLYYDGSNWVRLGHGANGQVLRTNGHGVNPSWTDNAAGVRFGAISILNPVAGYYKICQVPYAITATKYSLQCTGGTNIVAVLEEWDSNGANLVAAVDSSNITATAGTCVADDGTLSNPGIAALNFLVLHIISVSGTPTQGTCTVCYTVD